MIRKMRTVGEEDAVAHDDGWWVVLGEDERMMKQMMIEELLTRHYVLGIYGVLISKKTTLLLDIARDEENRVK